MTTFISKEVQAGLDAARKAAMREKSRLRVKAGAESWKILRMWDDGFALDADAAPHLRGMVDVYDGARHLCQALIVASVEDEGEIVCDFKYSTPHADTPPLDFVREEDAPVALIGRQ